jgi:parvulin-like peptidyl-prolyl isomerase
MIRTRLPLVLLAALTTPCSLAQEPSGEGQTTLADLPAVVARVNGIEISRERLLSEAQGAYRQLRGMGAQPRVDSSFLRTALDQLIASLLIHEQAKAAGFGAAPEEVDKRLLDIRASFTSEEAFLDNLGRQGLTEPLLRQDLAWEISRRKYLEESIVPEVEISEDEMRLYYGENIDRMRQPERVRVRHILVAVADDASEQERSQARERAAELQRRARAGEDFAALAYESSDDESRAQGGELPWIVRGQTVPSFERAAFALEPGELSPIVETPLGLHVIKAIDHQEGRVHSFEEVADRIHFGLANERAIVLLREKVEVLLQAASIERFLP